MNKHIHRLVFDRRRGMRVPAAEHVRGAGKAASGQTRSVAAVGVLSMLMASVADAQMVSVNPASVSAMGAPRISASSMPSGVLSANRTVADMVAGVLASGRPNLPVFSSTYAGDNRGLFDNPALSADGKIMTLLQKSGAIVVNWDSFDIGSGYTMRFVQPDGGRALNKVRGGDPSLIDGVLQANGEVMIENGAGIIFGRNSRVDVGSLVATALAVTQQAIGDLTDADSANALNIYRLRDGSAVFGGDESATAGFVATEAGAVIQALPGGKVLMVGPRVVNKGVIESPEGQTILAAGKTVYLFAPTDAAQRGLLVAVDNFSDATLDALRAEVQAAQDAGETGLNEDPALLGTVENVREGGSYASGLVRADKGTINLVGAAIRQKGQLTATSAVKGQNGAIFLTAMKDTFTPALSTHKAGKTLGSIELGEGSITEVLPSAEGLVSADGSQVATDIVEGVVSGGTSGGDIVLRKIGVRAGEVFRAPEVPNEPTRPSVPAEDASAEVKASYAAALAQYEKDKAAYDLAEALLQRSSDNFYRSRIDILGSDIVLRSGARVLAPAGEINVLAATDWSTSPLRLAGNVNVVQDGSRILMESGAVVDVSGLDLLLPAQRHQLKVQMFSIELADSPLQRAGVVYRKTVMADARQTLDIGDSSGYYRNLRYTAAELSTSGGLVRMQAQGALMQDSDSEVDFSGGSVTYDAGSIVTSLFLRNGAITRAVSASKDVVYDGFISDPTHADAETLARYGLSTLALSSSASQPGQFVGKSAGVAMFGAPVQSLGARLDGSVRMSDIQRTSGAIAERDPGLDGMLQASETLPPAWSGLDDLSAKHRLVRLPQLLTQEPDESASGYQPNLYASLRPTAGLLVIGREIGQESSSRAAGNLVSSVHVSASGVTAPRVSGDVDAATWQSMLEQVGTTSVLSASSLNDAGLAGLTVFADAVQFGNAGGQNAPAIRMMTGGSVQVRARTGDLVIHGDVSAAGGRIDLQAQGGDIVIASGSRLDAGGTRSANSSALPAFSGGSVTLRGNGDVVLEEGSALDVSGTAWRGSSGELVKGKAGSITLQANFGANGAGSSVPAGTIVLDGTLSAFDFSDGGKLNLQGLPTVVLGGNRDGAFRLADTLYADRGFGSVDVAALGDIDVIEGARISPVLVNMQALPMLQSQYTGNTFRLGVLDAGLRSGFSLGLSAQTEPDVNVQNGLPLGADLSVGEGALLDMGAGGSIALSAGGSLDMAGTLRALGGNVSLSLLGKRGASSSNDAETYGHVAGQAIRLHDGALIDVSGTVKAVAVRSPLGALSGQPTTLVGDVLAGGTVTLGGADGTPVRGQLLMDEGATIRLNGASGLLSRDATGAVTRVSAAAGTLNIMSTDGFSLLGHIEASAPDASVAGGTLNITLSREGKIDAVNGGGVAYPSGDEAGLRTVRIADSGESARQMDATDRRFGEGVMSAELVNDSGFDRVSLRADEAIELNGGVSLRASDGRTRLQALELDAAVLSLTDEFRTTTSSTGTDAPDHLIEAHYVSVGPRTGNGGTPGTVAASNRALGGNQWLAIRAGLIEVTGDAGVAGADRVDLHATLGRQAATTLDRRDGEIRFIGQRPLAAGVDDDRTLRGQLSFSGELNLVAGQVYASTLSDYTLRGDAGSTLNLFGPTGGSTSRTPLSALATLRIEASDVLLDGVLHQPVGSIVVTADTLTLGDHAKLSISADGTTVPVGTVVNNTQWLYSPEGSVSGTVPAVGNVVQDITALPITKQITLNGASLSLSSSSMIEAQAGGDIAGWQFNAGVGGSTDTFLRSGVFAILPDYTFDFAPYDADIRSRTEQIGTDLKAGDKVTITTANGVLQKGTYTLLDARYGILPGAVLVSTTSLNVNSALPVAVRNDDGSVIVSGHRTATGTAQNGGNDVRQALVLEPASTFRAKSDITVVSGNAFQTARSGRSDVTLPQAGDGGRVSLLSDSTFDWKARFNLKGQGELKAGELDLSMSDIVVRRSEADGGAQGAGVIDIESLNALGADSVLLGGVRTTLADGTVSIERRANSVTFQSSQDGGAASDVLTVGGELLAVATQRVAVDAGMTIESTGAASDDSRRYAVQGSGALLQVGQRAATDVVVEGVSAGQAAVLEVGSATAGSAPVTLRGASVQLDSTGALSISENAVLDSQSIGLGAGSVVVGEAAGDDADALQVSGSLLDRLNQSERLALRANDGSLAFVGGTELGSAAMRQITLDAPELLGRLSDGIDAADAVTRVHAQNVVLRNSSGRAASGTETGSGQLVIEARPVLSDGHTGGITIAASGAAGQRLSFGSTTLNSSGDIVFSGSGHIAAQGDAVLSAARVTASADSDQRFDAGGDLSIVRAEGGRTQGESLGAGGTLSLEGHTVTQAGTIDIEAGRLSIAARGDESGVGEALVFESGSVTRVDGRLDKISDTYAVASGGGSLDLRAQNGAVVIDGTLSASAPRMPEGVAGDEPDAGAIAVHAIGTGGQVRVGSSAVLDVSAASGQAGSVAVDARDIALTGSAQAAADLDPSLAQTGLDQLVASSRLAEGESLAAFSVRQRDGDLDLNTGVKAARVSLTTDTGNLVLGSDAELDATTASGGVVQLQAGQDLVLGDGSRIVARSTREGANGGDVLLSASDGYVRIGGVTVVADSAGDAQDGRIVVRARQTQNALGQYTGMNVVRTEGSEAADLQARRVQLAGVRVYDGAGLVSLGTAAGSTSNLNLSELVSAANAFAGNQDAILDQAGLTGLAQARVRGEAEIRAQGNFTIANDLVLAASSAGQPMNLTVRAAGDLTVNGSVSAGLNNALTTGTVQAGEGASLRFVAGADLSSADANAIRNDAASGHFTLANNKLIRTTTGSIDVHASGDVRLMAATTSTPSAIYVTGGQSVLASDQVFALENSTAAINRTNTAYRSAVFTERGERLMVSAGGNVGSYASVTVVDGVTQYVDQMLGQGTGNYFYHGGNPLAPLLVQRVPVAWWSGFNEFRQGFASFGGGNVDVVAGGNVSNVAVVVPTSARSVLNVDGAGEVLSSALDVRNGGDLSVRAGADIVGGVYFLGRGEGHLIAGGSIRAGADAVADGVTPGTSSVFEPGAMLALMDGHWSVSAVGDLTVSHIYNPTIVPFRFTGTGNLNGTTGGTAAASGLTNANASVYYTYAEDAGATLASLQGDVLLAPNAQNFNRMHATSPVGNLDLSHTQVGRDASVPASVLPPVLSIVSLDGDVTIDTGGRTTSSERNGSNGQDGSALYVMPSALSDVSVYAGRDLLLQANFQLLDAQQVQLGLPTPDAVATFAASPANNNTLARTFSSLGFNLGAAGAAVPNNRTGEESAATAVRVGTNLESLDDKPLADLGQALNDSIARFIAGRDVAFSDRNDDGRSTTSFLRSSRPAEVAAGRDIVNPNFLGQNFDDADETRLTAGRDIVGVDVAVAGNKRIVAVGGPGALTLAAGRDLELNQMDGVLAIGNLVNASITSASAKITVAAGMDRSVNLDELRARHDSVTLRLAIDRALNESGLVPGDAAAWSDLSDDDAYVAFGLLSKERQVEAVQTYLDEAFAALYLPEEAGRSADYYRSAGFQKRKLEAMWARIEQVAGEAQSIAVSSDAAEEAARKQRRLALFAAAEDVVDLAGLGKTFDRAGDVNVGQSRVHNQGQGGGTQLGSADDSKGGIDVIAAGQVLAGLPTPPASPGGFINFEGGSFRSLSGGDFLAGDQKVISMGRGNLLIYTVDGSIDSGKGSNTAASAPLPTRRFNPLTGKVETIGQPPTTGSGFQKVQTPDDMTPLIGLYAPNGEIRALDAFIKGDANISVLTPVVLGGDNIGGASGVAAAPAPAVSLSLTPRVSDTAAGTKELINDSESRTLAQANSMLTVDLLGFGDAVSAGDVSAPRASEEKRHQGE